MDPHVQSQQQDGLPPVSKPPLKGQIRTMSQDLENKSQAPNKEAVLQRIIELERKLKEEPQHKTAPAPRTTPPLSKSPLPDTSAQKVGSESSNNRVQKPAVETRQEDIILENGDKKEEHPEEVQKIKDVIQHTETQTISTPQLAFIPPSPLAEKVKTPEQIVQDKIRAKEQERLTQITTRRELERSETPFRQEIQRIETSLQELTLSLDPFLVRENSLNVRIEELRRSEEVAQSVEEKQRISQSRWQVEDERSDLERKKWGIEQSIEQVLLEKNTKLQSLEDLQRQGDIIDEKIKNIDKEIERIKLEFELEQLFQKKEAIELQWIEKNDERDALKKEIDLISNEILITTQERMALEKQEKEAQSSQEEREIEKLRQDTEKRLRVSEKKLWEKQASYSEVERTIELLKPSYQTTLSREEMMKERLNSLSL